MLTRHIREFLQVTPGPFPDFWVGPGDEATPRVIISRSGEPGNQATVSKHHFEYSLVRSRPDVVSSPDPTLSRGT